MKKIISIFLTAVFLLAVFARPPGIMLSEEAGGLTFEICTANGLQVVTLPAEDGEPSKHVDPTCTFFAAQTAALLDGSPSIHQNKLSWQMWAHFPARDIAIKRRAHNSHLTRAPPALS